MQRWWPDGLRTGEDPDPRFTLANERTFLAWVRTSLGLVAAGIAVEAFSGDVVSGTERTVVVLGLLGGAALLAVVALVRWVRLETAMRHRRALPLPGAAVVLTGFVLVLVVVLVLTLVS